MRAHNLNNGNPGPAADRQDAVVIGESINTPIDRTEIQAGHAQLVLDQIGERLENVFPVGFGASNEGHEFLFRISFRPPK